jgi:hypothetical protein
MEEGETEEEGSGAAKVEDEGTPICTPPLVAN